MTIMATELDPDLMTFLSQDPAIACDNSDRDWCAKEDAKWIAHLRCPGCQKGRPELWCGPCKDLIIATEDGFECAQCGELVFPGRRFVARFDPLEK